jgi:GT2 family glycosyltransferase/ubiquinone/menaquinone biosynthesis C-methylase UbiE/glycosyltransferase involved in cell wall biosynthesis
MGESIGSMISRAHSLAADGERFLPGIMAGDIELEHVHRYKFAAQLSVNKTVLDIASGEGYGSAYLSQTARRVIGVDISQDAVESAREKYERPNLEFLVGSCSEIPLDDATVDVVVSFETIEHHAEHEAMMREIKRVLRPRGLIVISSPDKLEYADKPSFRNPFHVKELYREEFQALLDAHFKCVRMFGQRVLAGSALLCEHGAQSLMFHETGTDSSPQKHLPAPKYLVAIASDRKLPVIYGGLLERDPAMREPDAETTASKRVAAILRTISINESQCLKGRLNGLWYLQRNQDVAAKGVDPVAHWIEYGVKEGRLPAHNVEELARELIAEHETRLREALEEKEREFHQIKEESSQRQHMLEAQIEQTRSQARTEAESHLRVLTDRERSFSEQLRKEQQAASEERETQGQLANEQRQAVTKEYEERERRLQLTIEAKERELRDSKDEAQDRQRAAEAQIEQTRSLARAEVEGHLRMLAERERAFSEQFSQQQSAREEREAHHKAAIHQLQLLNAQHEEREQRLRTAIEEKEREFRALQRESIEQRKALEAVIGQNRVAASYAMETQLRALAERERALGEQLSQQQRAASEEKEAQRAAADQKIEALSALHDEREQRLRVTIEETERELRDAREVADAHLRMLADREHAFGEELSQKQRAANDEAEAQRAAADRKLEALSALHDEHERRLQVTIEETERELRNAREAAEANLRMLADRERAFGEELSRRQQAANDEGEAQWAAANRKLEALSALHDEREQRLQVTIEDTERELRNAREVADAHLRMLADREHAFGVEHSRQLLEATEERASQQATAIQRLQALQAEHDERERHLRATIEEKERALQDGKEQAHARQRELEMQMEQIRSDARNEVEAQLRALVDRERVFAADFAQVKALVDEELRLLRSQYLFSVNIIRSALNEMPQRRFWRRVARTLKIDTMVSDRSEAQVERQVRQTHGVNAKVKTIEDLLSLDGHDFIMCTYRSLLGRKPDATGYAFYIEQLESSGDKAAIIDQIGRSREAKQNRINMIGLKRLMRHQKWRRLPILQSLMGKFDHDPKVSNLRRDLEDIDRRVAAIDQGLSSRLSHFESNKLPPLAIQIDAIFNSFDDRKYVKAHPDVAASGMNPYEHFVRFGWREKRHLSAVPEGSLRDGAVAWGPENERHSANRPNAGSGGADQLPLAPIVVHVERAAKADGIKWSCIMEPASETFQGDGYSLTRFMQFLWTSRQDLQTAFDIHQPGGRLNFFKWLAMNGMNEHGLTAKVFPRNLLEGLVNLGGDIGAMAGQALQEQHPLENGTLKGEELQISNRDTSGANLVGYAFGEFGRGEDVRMVARSLSSLQVPFGIIDQDAGLHGTGDTSVANWVVNGPQFDTNIFLINADLFPFLPFKLGHDFCLDRHNIGYWAWELSMWPAEFELALDMVDEVWAISEFVAESVRTRARVPVITMPNAVTVPQLGGGYTKRRYGLPEDSFVFYFTFDAASHLDRKNPVAVVRAFNAAFPDRETKVHLLLKTMNVERGVPLWEELQKEVGGNERITILTDRMSREEVLGLNLACDAFVSLHRSEGFGRCVAEAMAYGKPVIATNYSGTRDFAKEGTACVVDYRLVPVPEGAYPFCDNQVWAEPDIGHAAALMQRLVHDEPYCREIALAGQNFVIENFSEKSIGTLYAKRLSEIRALRLANSPRNESEPVSDTVLLGHIDSPTAEECIEASDTVPIEGWMASPQGIDNVRIYVDSAFVANAHYGVLRPDIHSAFPQLPNSGRSGFCYLLNIADYADGDHTFSVVASCRSGISRTWTQPFYKRKSFKYQEWLHKSDALYTTKSDSGIHRSDGLLLSLVLRLGPMIDTVSLSQTLDSLAVQRYPNFEVICLLGDASQEKIIADTALSVNLTAKLQFLLGKGNTWSSVVDQCCGELIGLVDLGDIFRPWAFGELDESIRENGPIDLIYGDEDIISGSDRSDPSFKPGWSPIFLDSYNYIGRPWFASRTAFSSAVSGSLDSVDVDEHELLKIIGRKDSLVGHIPTVLLSRPNPSAHAQSQTVVRGNISEGNVDEDWPKVSIIIPTRLGDEELISQCFNGLERNTDYPNFEVIVVVNNLRDPDAEERHLGKRAFRVVHWDGPFNWAGINNLGVTQAKGELFLFLNDDVEPLEKDWLKILVQTLVRTKAGAVGCLLRYPNGTIQHSGVHFVNYGGGARHLFRFCAGNEARLSWLMKYPREVSAVTGACLLTTRDCFEAVNGFDDELPLVGNDTDYCLRVWRNGSSVVMQPEAKLIHHEGVSRQGMSEVKDVERFWKKWAKFLELGDFFSNPNLDAARDDWTVNPSIERTFKLRRRYSTDQHHSRGMNELEDGLFNMGTIDDSLEAGESPALQKQA